MGCSILQSPKVSSCRSYLARSCTFLVLLLLRKVSNINSFLTYRSSLVMSGCKPNIRNVRPFYCFWAYYWFCLGYFYFFYWFCLFSFCFGRSYLSLFRLSRFWNLFPLPSLLYLLMNFLWVGLSWSLWSLLAWSNERLWNLLAPPLLSPLTLP